MTNYPTIIAIISTVDDASASSKASSTVEIMAIIVALSFDGSSGSSISGIGSQGIG